MSDFAVSAAIGAVDRVTSVFNKMKTAVGAFGGHAQGSFDKAEKAENKFVEAFKAQFAALSAEHLVEHVFDKLKELPEAINGFVEKGNQIEHTSQIIGTTAENYQRLIYAAHMLDISQEDVVTSMERLNNNMGQLRGATGPLYSTMLRINPQLAMQLIHTKDTSSALMVMSDALRASTSASQRAAIAQAAFGRAGQVMLPLLLEGSAGIQKLMGEADKYGEVLSDSMVAQTMKADDTLKKLRGTVANLKDTALSALLEKLQPLIEHIQTWVTANRDLIATKIQDFVRQGVDVISKLGPVLKIAVSIVEWLLDHKIVILGLWVAWTGAQIALNIAMDANPIGLITLGIEALIAVVVTVIMYWKQITGALESAWNWFDKLYNKSLLLRNAIFFLASPIWLVVEAVRTLIDLISGKGWQSFQNFIPPWLKGATDALGITKQGGGQITQAPNSTTAGGMYVNVGVNVDNSRAPGVSSAVGVRTAPALTGYQGVQYAGGAQ